MRWTVTRMLVFLVALGLFSATASATSIPVGFVSFDVTTPGTTANFDVTNQTGPNSSVFPDTTWPVTNSISLSSLSLTLDFTNGTSQTFDSGFFALEPDGLSFVGPTIPLGGTNPVAKDATLTGAFSTTTFNLNDGSTVTVSPTFSGTITDAAGALQDGDFAIIDASTGTRITPEPGTWVLLGTGIGLLGLARRSKSRT